MRARRGSLATAFALAAVLPAASPAACKLENIELPVKLSGSRAVATVGINDMQVPLTVDSGASFSMLTDAAAAQLNLPLRLNDVVRFRGLTGKIDTHLTRVDKLGLFNSEISRVDFVVGGNEPGGGTMGLMGRNILSIADTEYDLAHGMIRFHFPKDCADADMAYWAGDAPVTEIDLVRDYTNPRPELRARVKVNGNDFVAMFDSGATTTVTARMARRAGVAEADWKPAGSMMGAGRGRAQSWSAVFDRFEIGGESITRNRLSIADIDLADEDMLLGIDFFLSHRIYVSRDRWKMFITYNGGPVFALDRTPNGSAIAAGVDPADSAVATADDKLTADDFARRGAASAARRDFEAALADLDRACELEPTSAAYFAQRGAILVTLKRVPKAREDFDKALDLDPNQADARFRRMQLRLIAKDRDGAKADLDALDKTIAPQSQMRLSMATYYLTLEQPAVALLQLNQWLPAHPHESGREAALYSRCRVRLLLGTELDQAFDDCDDAVDGEPKNASYLALRGWAYLRLGRNGKAVSDFDRSLEHRPGDAGTLYGRGLAKTRNGDPEHGNADLDAARKIQPDVERRVARAGLTSAVDTASR